MMSSFIYLSLAILAVLCPTDAEIQPKITIFGPTYATVPLGGTKEIECQSPLTPNAKIRWYKGLAEGVTKFEIFPKTNPLFETNEFQSLVIVNAKPGIQNHDGFYTCSATNTINTTRPGYDAKVEVEYLENDFQYTPRDSYFYNIDGKRLAWANCKPPAAVPPAIPIWINGSSGEPISKDNPRIEIRTFSRNGLYTQIIIHNSTEADAGAWKCRVEHKLGTKEAGFQITFYGPPKAPSKMRVTATRLNGFVMAWDYVRNDLASYEINVTDVVSGVVKEYKFEENPSYVSQTLSYTFTDLQPGRQYSIIMRAIDKQNQLGAWNKPPFLVTTVDVLAPVVLIQPAKMSVGEGKQFNITCGVQAKPAASFTWYQNGVAIPESDARYIIQNSTLVIKKASRVLDNNAKYKCFAKNSLGSVTSDEGVVTVQWIDETWELKPSTSIFYTSQKFKRISARPPKNSGQVSMQWRKGTERRDIHIRTHPRYSPTQYLDASRKFTYALDISTLDITIENSYTIYASNLGGVRKSSFLLVMAGAPPAIRTLKVTGQKHSELVLQWDPPRSQNKLRDLGSRYTYRQDIKYFEIKYRSRFTQEKKITTFGEFTDSNFFTRKTTITDLRGGVLYEFYIRCVDHGDQEGDWSPALQHQIPANLPPFIVSGPRLYSEVKVGGQLILSCQVTATPPATITWYMDSNVPVTADKRFSINVENLTLTNIDRHHTGAYYCKATNTNGETTSSIGRVDVIFFGDKFQFTEGVAPVYDMENFREVLLLCIPPESYPAAEVNWLDITQNKYINFEQQTDITRDDRYKKDGKVFYSLRFLNAVKYAGTEIGCVAYNKRLGFDYKYRTASTNITLFGKPELKKGVQYRWQVGPSLFLQWEKERYDFKSYIVVVKEAVEPYKIIKVETITDTSMLIKDVSDTTSYKVEVKVIDRAGQTSDPASVIVKDLGDKKVKLTKDLLAVGPQLKEGQSTSLSCDFAGDPKPSISWFKDGKNVTVKNSRFQVSEDNTKLTLLSVERNIHAGRYQCLANNLYYRNVPSTISTVTVLWIDQNFQYASEKVFFYDLDGYRKVRFTCAPPLSSPAIDRTKANYVIWLHDNTVIIKPVARKTIDDKGLLKDYIEFNATKDDIGQYSCVYPHMAGVRRQNMTLASYDGPLPPSGLRVNITRLNVVVLAWKAPDDVIDHYKITYGINTDTEHSVTIDKGLTSYELKDLQEETLYKITLATVKDEKASLPLREGFKTVTKPAVPSAVRMPVADEITISGAKLTWLVPLERRGNLKLTYKVKVCKNTTSCTTYPVNEKTSLQLTNLEADTTYTYEITVKGDLPIDGPTVSGNFKTVSKEGPPAIGNFQVVGRKWNLLEVSWDKPDDMSKVSHYILEVTGPDGMKSKNTIDRNSAAYRIERLKEGLVYALSIYAEDRNGRRGEAATLKYTTLDLGNPGPPRNVKMHMVPGFENTKVLLTWDTPDDQQLANNIPDLLLYHIKVCNGGHCNNQTNIRTRKVHLNGLSPGTKYSYVLTTLREDRLPGRSQAGHFATYDNSVSEPTLVSASKTDSNTIYLKWYYPEVLAGTSKTKMEFSVKLCEKGTQICRTQKTRHTSMKIENLKAKTSYSISIQAQHESGTWSSAVDIEASTTSGKSDSSGGMSAGVVVGIILAVIVVLILCGIGYLLYKRNKESDRSNIGEGNVNENMDTLKAAAYQDRMQRSPQYRPGNHQTYQHQQRDMYRDPYRQAQYQQGSSAGYAQQQYRRPQQARHSDNAYRMEMSRRR